MIASAPSPGPDWRETATPPAPAPTPALGVALNHLVGRTFRVGGVRMRGVRLAEPCVYLEQLTGLVGVRAALVHRGGLRAEILDDGELVVGDAVDVD